MGTISDPYPHLVWELSCQALAVQSPAVSCSSGCRKVFICVKLITQHLWQSERESQGAASTLPPPEGDAQGRGERNGRFSQFMSHCTWQSPSAVTFPLCSWLPLLF